MKRIPHKIASYTLRSFFLIGLVAYVSCKDKKQELKEIRGNNEKINVVYVLADDLGYGDLSCYNPNGKIPTENLDKLAAEGMKFTDAHTSSSVCTPTRYGILTGRYNWRSSLKSGVLTGTSKALISSKRTTVASLLKNEGYHTAFIGKWHLGWNWGEKENGLEIGEGWSPDDYEGIDFSKPITNSPNSLGFTYAYGHSGSLDMAPYVYVENEKVTAQPNRATVDTSKYGWWREGPTGADFIHEEVTPNFFKKSIEYIKARSKAKQPFFLYLALPSPHTPILPTKEWQGKSALNPYGDFVMMIDTYMGQLVSALKNAGIEKNTLVIFTSDNGCSPQADYVELASKGHNPSFLYRGHKADIYEGGHRVPFIVKWPEVIKPNSVATKTICTTDLMATLADILNLDLKDNEGEDSFSMLPLFKSEKANAYKRELTVHHSINGSFAIRKGEWKLIFCPGSGGWSDPKPNAKETKGLPKFQLYNLEKDPQEKNNEIANYPEIAEELHILMKQILENGRSTPGEKQKNELPMDGSQWQQINAITGT
ncbi:arylsulfatase A family protein [Galbibacter orientalis DSM 19592]|uniref:Arylsulfatase A family protein n=1 Tax=Galbibacter orientalis DSM 19592 TaxID=926559 RepID=I3C9V6_9FLAO|nr:arylsulfatase [Galbibacter orientalis]EIJ40399.1 arylsulfatase A family protein [Galbibacter orientalis DSM 19592]